jgi:hypothetical protein
MSAERLATTNQNPLELFKQRVHAEVKKLGEQITERLQPENPELYARLNAYPKEFGQKFILLSGTKHEGRNLEELRKVIDF